jgi:hypothetical protein
MTRLATGVAPTLCAFGVLAGCAVSGPEQTSDRVTVIEQDVTVAPDHLAMPRAGNEALLARQPGDVLVSSRGTGFLRKVVAVHDLGDQIEIATEPAALNDAIIEAEYDGEVRDSKADWSGPKFAGVIFTADPFEVQAAGNAKLSVTKGKISFDPSLDLALQMHHAHITKFDLVASGAFDADLAFHLETDGAAEIHYTKDLWTSPSATFIQMIGPVPVVEVVEAVVGVEVDAVTEGQTSLDIGASAHSGVAMGSRYANGSWQRVGDHSLSLQTVGPTLTTTNNVSAAVRLNVELHVQFYDLAGPYLAISPYVQAEYTPGQGITPSWGTEGAIGGQLNLLGAGNDSKLLGVEATLFDFNCEFGTPISACLK